MSGYFLRLTEDRFGPVGYSDALVGVPRVLYVLSGQIAVESGGGEAIVESGKAWFGVGECRVKVVSDGAKLLRFELMKVPILDDGLSAGPVKSRLLLNHLIDLDPALKYLMRCDRVDFDPGGEALPHKHRGGGIRWLLTGRLDVKVSDGPFRTMRPGDAWFESGKEAVHAIASQKEATSFIRVSILPREIQGKSSIMYVSPEDAASSRPRRYTILVDDSIEI